MGWSLFQDLNLLHRDPCIEGMPVDGVLLSGQNYLRRGSSLEGKSVDGVEDYYSAKVH